MKLLGSTKDKITKYENGDNLRHSEINETVLVHWDIVNSNYQHDSRVLRTFVLDKSFGQSLDILPKNHIFL